MPGTEITVHVNRGAANTLESDLEAIETDRKLSVVLRGHERPAHVHCRLDGDLDRIATIDQTNHYIGPGDVTTVPIDVDGAAIDDPIEGRVEVVTGYGSESLGIDVTLRPPREIDVDESLSRPSRRRSQPGSNDDADGSGNGGRSLEDVLLALGLDSTTLAVIGLGAFALLVAVATAATVGGMAALIGLVFVLVGVGIAIWLVLGRETAKA
ncbi:DUF7524 family protein [Natrarchaeobaculum aegyptiacum]|uniref:Uncharacterized protein n=1 Tax=Natrarchaeobaculum aegyptiacum TaxID=745377 RepID=A0A2Z2HYZ8_9EURY|nr:hypothetical protein [Natrarchaeobaculum aegyptiacum]ARS91107.1 hypothetical protein B1756_16130 [Natrarchaeobaculum aegyptiacum]